MAIFFMKQKAPGTGEPEKQPIPGAGLMMGASAVSHTLTCARKSSFFVFAVTGSFF
jgi:hypothetical protein